MGISFGMNYSSRRNKRLHNHSMIIIWSMFFGSALSLAAAFYGGSSVALIVSMIFIIYALMRPISERSAFVIIGLTNTKGLVLAGASCSVVICFASVVIALIERKRINRKLLIWSTLYAVYSLQYCFREAGVSYGIVFPIKMISVLIFYYFLSENEKIVKAPVEFLCNSTYCYLLGTLCAVLGSFSGNSRLSVYGNDPNALGLQMVFLLAMFCVLYFRYNQISTINFSICFALSSVIGVATGSRMFWILFGCLAIGSVVLNFNKFGKSIWIVLFLIFSASMFLKSDFGKSVLEELILRQDVMLDRGDISNGRLDLWKAYIEYFNRNKLLWLFGVGTYTVTGIRSVAHNMFLEGVTTYGIFGLALLFRIYVLIISNFKAKLCLFKTNNAIYTFFHC